MADAWLYRYTDFGESRGELPQPVLRAVVSIGKPGSPTAFSGIIDTGGPITVVARHVIDSGGGDPVDSGRTASLRLGGSTNRVPLFDLTLEVRPPREQLRDPAISWRSLVAVLDPWPLQGTAVILGQTGFLNEFTITFGPDHFSLEPGAVFETRFPDAPL